MNGDHYGVAKGRAFISLRRRHLASLSLLSKERLLGYFAAVFALVEDSSSIFGGNPCNYIYYIYICK